MLFQPFTFPNGMTAKNRFFKSAMEEQLAHNNQPTPQLVHLYHTWAKGGAGVLITGNVMVAENGKGSINDVVLSDERSMAVLQRWAQAGKQNGTLIIMAGTMQQFWKHEVPKTSVNVGERINLTFRSIARAPKSLP